MMFDRETIRKARVSRHDTDLYIKVLALTRVLKEIYENLFSFNKKTVALKGGTALNFIYLDTPRLSIDMDFNIVLLNRDMAYEERDRFLSLIKEISKKLGLNYVLDKATTKNKAFKRIYLKYINPFSKAGDKIKVELNVLERMHFLQLKTKKLIFGSTFEVLTFSVEELFAMKLRALIGRTVGRDLIDIYNILKKFDFLGKKDFKRVVLLNMVYGALRKELRTREKIMLSKDIFFEQVKLIDESRFRNEIRQFMKRGEEVSFLEIQNNIEDFVEAFFNNLNQDERKFLNFFNTKRKIDLSLLFEDSEHFLKDPLLKYYKEKGLVSQNSLQNYFS